MTATDFELFYGILTEPMLLASTAGSVVAVNEAAAALLNRGANVITGAALSDLVTDSLEKVTRLLSLFARSRRFVGGRLTFRTGGSETLTCRIEGALLSAADERALLLRLPQDVMEQHRSLNERITHINQEIFDHKQAAQTAALLSAIVDSSDDAIISKDLNGVITSWNKASERLFGYTAAEAVGQSITLIIPSERLDEEPEILERLRRGERVDHFETVRLRKDGSRLNISLTISPVKDLDGRITGASKVARDITERMRQDKALLDANEALKRAVADLEQFAYSASHDLQEPLRMVSAYSELLEMKFGGQLGETGKEYVAVILQGARRMAALLKDLRTYTLASTGEAEPTEDIDANETLQNALRNFELAIEESGASVTRGTLPRVRMHEFQLEQVFQNLIGNAIRYRGADPLRIHIASRAHDGEWLFSIRDNGIGIEPKFKEQIFGIFKRLHSAAEYPGNGMGLAICERIVKRSGGRIWVESQPGSGSTFYFTVPRGEAGVRSE